MITEEQIHKIIGKHIDAQDVYNREDAYNVVKAAIIEILEQLEHKQELKAINEAVEGVNSEVRYNKRLEKITRVEVIDHNPKLGDSRGRVYTNYSVNSCETEIQDQGRTLKIFLK